MAEAAAHAVLGLDVQVLLPVRLSGREVLVAEAVEAAGVKVVLAAGARVHEPAEPKRAGAYAREAEAKAQ